MTTTRSSHEVHLDTTASGWRASIRFEPPHGNGFAFEATGRLSEVSAAVAGVLADAEATPGLDAVIDDWNELLGKAQEGVRHVD